MANFFANARNAWKAVTGSQSDKQKYVEENLPTVDAILKSGNDSSIVDIISSGVLPDVASLEMSEGMTYGDYVNTLGAVYVATASLGIASSISDSVSDIADEILNDSDSSEDEAMQEDHKADLSAVGLIALVLLPLIL